MIQITSDIRRAICFKTLLIINILPLVAIWEMPMDGNIDLLSESQFRMVKKCSTKWDCLLYEMLYIRTIRPNLKTPLGLNYLFNFQYLYFIHLFTISIYSISLFYFHLIMTFWKRRAMFYNFYCRLLLSNILPNLYLSEADTGLKNNIQTNKLKHFSRFEFWPLRQWTQWGFLYLS